MPNKRLSDETLALIEDLVNDCGFSYPIAWALSFIVDNEKYLVKLLEASGDPGLAKTLKSLAKEIKTGIPQ
jgi:hypothetical protein